jgi:cytoskeleton protein RodZ
MTQGGGPLESQGEDLGSGSGARLREAREARRMDIVQVANELRLSARNIEALEAEDLSQLPEPSYICGYLRSYAKLLGLPSDEILDNFPGVRGYLASVKSTVMPTRMVVRSEEASRQAPLPGFTPANVVMVAGAAVMAVVLIMQLRDDDAPAPAEQPAVAQPSPEPVAATPPATAVPAESAPAVATPEPLPAATPVAAPSVAPVTPTAELARPDVVQTPPAQSQSPEPAEAPVAQPAPGAAPTPSKLVLEFRGESWLEVHDGNNRRLARELVPAGESRTLSGLAPFNVVLGAGSAVDIRYNDVVYDMRRYARAKMVILTIGKAADNRDQNPAN